MSTETYGYIQSILIFKIIHVPVRKVDQNIYSSNFVIIKRQ